MPDIIMVDKPRDATIFLSDGGYNAAYVIKEMLKNPSIRNTRIYIMNIKTNPVVKKYIKMQMENFRSSYIGCDIRYFSISDVPEEDIKNLSTKELIEKWANAAILDFFSQHLQCGSGLEIYTGFDASNYQELQFDPVLQDRIHHPLMHYPANRGVMKIIDDYPGLFKICVECSNATEEKHWCGGKDCYDCKYIIHSASMYNFIHNTRGLKCKLIRGAIKEWFDIDLPATVDDLTAMMNKSQNVGCGCADCRGTNESSFRFAAAGGHKKIVYGNRSNLKQKNFINFSKDVFNIPYVDEDADITEESTTPNTEKA